MTGQNEERRVRLIGVPMDLGAGRRGVDMGPSAIRIAGVGQLVANNRLHDAPHSAIIFYGNDHRIERNEIFDVLRETEMRLGVSAGQTTEDGKFDLQRVACLGCCALAPVVSVDGTVHAGVSTKQIPSILKQYGGT